MPLRRSSIPRGALLQLYRPIAYGNLANIFMLDTRQYRTDQPCGDNVQPVCDAARDPKATLLGAAQERWLLDGLNRSRSGWNLLAQQIPMARLDRMPGPERRYSMDKWDGYEASRSRLLKFLDTRKPANPVSLAGDVHNNWVNDVRLNGDDPSTPVVATEFVGTSISSTGDGADMSPLLEAMAAENECVRFCNNQRGYVRFDLSRAELRADFRVVEYVSRPGSPISTRASFVVRGGTAGAQKT
jgi:alkaline phosphatase D